MKQPDSEKTHQILGVFPSFSTKIENLGYLGGIRDFFAFCDEYLIISREIKWVLREISMGA